MNDPIGAILGKSIRDNYFTPDREDSVVKQCRREGNYRVTESGHTNIMSRISPPDDNTNHSLIGKIETLYSVTVTLLSVMLSVSDSSLYFDTVIDKYFEIKDRSRFFVINPTQR